MNRGLTILLLISLAFNVFLGGFVAGRYLGKPSHGREHGDGHFAGPMFGDLSALSEGERKTFIDVFKNERPELRKNFGELRELRRAFSASLAADPWDRAAAEEALEKLKAVESAHQVAMARLLIDAFEGLSPEDRKALVASQSKRFDRWRRGGRMRMRDFRGDGPEGDMPPPPPPLEDDLPPPPEE